MLTEQDVLDAFDNLGGGFVQLGALRAELEAGGNQADEVGRAIEAALVSGALVSDSTGGLRKGP